MTHLVACEEGGEPMNTDDLIQLILAVGITCGALGAIMAAAEADD